MKTYLILIPQENASKIGTFAEILENLHENLTEEFRFEISTFGQNIGFCFSAKENTATIISGEIYAAFPSAEILEVSPLWNNGLKPIVYMAEISLARTDIFPIKNFDEFTADPLGPILNVLSRKNLDENFSIQISVRSKNDSGFFHFKLNWRKRLEKIRRFFRVKYWFKKNATKIFDKKIKEKISQKLFVVNLKIVVSSQNSEKISAIFGALQNFNTIDLNKFAARRIRKISTKNISSRNRTSKKNFLLSTRELAGLFHLPDEKTVPNLLHVLSRKGEPPADLPTDFADKNISFFGATNFHGACIPFGIRRSDRRRHLYSVGKSGSGKSKFLELLIQNDLQNGHGVGVLDPHGDLVDNVLKMIPENRKKDVIIFDPGDLQFPICFNPLADVPPELKIRVTIGFIEIFKKLFGAGWSPRLEHVLRQTTLALLDTPGATILSILKMLTDKNYRQNIVRNIRDDVVKNFWVNEFAGWSEKFDNEAITPLLNKVGQFVSTNMIRNIVGQSKNKINFREIMDSQKIILMKISKGILGEENAALLGAIAITKIYQAAMSRADTPEEMRKDFYFYVDEFQNFATDTFDEILSEARKYRLNLTLAHQFLGQLPPQILKTVFGNVGSMVSFRVGGDDAGILSVEFNPRFAARDILNLGVRDFYCKISINGELREAFSGRTLDLSFPTENFAEEIQQLSRENFCRPVAAVERELASESDFSESLVEEFVEPVV